MENVAPAQWNATKRNIPSRKETRWTLYGLFSLSYHIFKMYPTMSLDKSECQTEQYKK